MRLSPFLVAAALGLSGGGPVEAHEFWISPEAYQLPAAGTIAAAIRVGERFSGASYVYLPQNFRRFELVQGETVVPVEGRPGDRPALSMQAPGEGLWVAVHETTDSFVTYSEWEKFENFVTHKDAAWALADHAARGLPETGFRERYSRYGKSLISVGNGQGADRETGLLTELVALANPYTDDLSGGLPVKLVYEGAPRAGAQVEIFARDAAGQVAITTARTDADGVALIPVVAGTEYLLDAVVLRPLEGGAGNAPVWESLWASLTFRMPE
jgi:hypothetical protein